MDTVWFENGKVNIIDQTLLPGEVKTLALGSIEDVWEAIKTLRVRGAPAIGVTAALALKMLADAGEPRDEIEKAGAYLVTARPTAVNLSWAVSRVLKADDISAEAMIIRDEDIEVCRALGENGIGLIKPGSGVLTHCNAGALATVRYGTATAPLYLAHERGYGLHIYCDETRPLLQGARLTAYELSAAGMDVTLQCDGMAATLMQKGLIDAVFVGCDRMAMNGDGANKIGTFPLAIAAKRFGVPFYMFVPISTFDKNSKTGADITIEMRDGAEIAEMWYAKRMAPQGIKLFNPSFDVTPNDLITGIVTERGVLYPPFEKSIAEVLK